MKFTKRHMKKWSHCLECGKSCFSNCYTVPSASEPYCFFYVVEKVCPYVTNGQDSSQSICNTMEYILNAVDTDAFKGK